MKETKFTDTQIVLVLKQGQDDASAARCAKRPGLPKRHSITGTNIKAG